MRAFSRADPGQANHTAISVGPANLVLNRRRERRLGLSRHGFNQLCQHARLVFAPNSLGMTNFPDRLLAAGARLSNQHTAPRALSAHAQLPVTILSETRSTCPRQSISSSARRMT